LQLLQSVRGADFSSQVLPLLSHSSPFLREEAVRTLHAIREDHRREAEQLLGDASGAVRFAAIEYLCTRDRRGAATRLKELLKDGRIDVRISAARWASEYPVPGFEPSRELVDSLMRVQGPEGAHARAAAAALASRMPKAEALHILKSLLKDPGTDVVAVAAVTTGK